MPLPDDRRVARFGPAPCGVAERCVPAPRVGADDLHPALRQIECRLCAHPAALIGKIVGAIDRARLDEYDIERLQVMPDPRELGLDLGTAHDTAVRAVRKVDLPAAPEKQ